MNKVFSKTELIGKEKSRFENKFRFLFCCFILLILFGFQTIAYSAMSGTSIITGEAYFRVNKDTRITQFSVAQTYGGAVSSYEEYSKDTLQTHVNLPYSDSYIKYRITVRNYGDVEMTISDIINDGENHSNLNFELENISYNEKICDDENNELCLGGATKTFYIKISAKQYNSAYTTYTINIDLVFDYMSSPLVKGSVFNAAISNRNIREIIFTSEIPPSGWDTVPLAENGSSYIVGWEDDGTFYVSDKRDDLDIVANVDCSYMFSNLPNLTTINLNNLSFNETVNMKGAFSNVATTTTSTYFNLINSTNISGANIVNMSYMFDGSFTNIGEVTIDLGGIVVSNVTDMSFMFRNMGLNSDLVALNLEDIYTWSLVDMSYMFQNFGKNADYIIVSGIDNLYTGNVTNMMYTFQYMGSNALRFDIGDLGYWDTSNVTNMQGLFYGAGYNSSDFTYIGEGLDKWDTSNVTDMSYMFYKYGRNSSNWYVGNLGTKLIDEYKTYMAWDTSNVTNMSYMFAETAYNMDIWDLGEIGTWNTNKVTDMSFMFMNAGRGCSGFYPLYIGTGEAYDEMTESWYVSWDVSNVTNMSHMFDQYGFFNSLEDMEAIGDINNWNISKVTDMSYMFNEYQKNYNYFWTFDLSGWNASNVTNMSYMFYDMGGNNFNALYPPLNIRTNVIKTNITSTILYICDVHGNVLQQYAPGNFPTGNTTRMELSPKISYG